MNTIIIGDKSTGSMDTGSSIQAWTGSKRLHPSVVVTPAPVQVPTLLPLVPSFTSVVRYAENFSPCPHIHVCVCVCRSPVDQCVSLGSISHRFNLIHAYYSPIVLTNNNYNLLHLYITVSPWAISSSGTSSGRNCAGVIHGHLVLTGKSVTIMSPLAGKYNFSQPKNFFLLL